MTHRRARRAGRLIVVGALALSLGACENDATDDDSEPGEGVIEEDSGVDDLADS